MKKIYPIALVIAMMAAVPTGALAQDWGRLLQAGVKAVQAMSLSDSQVQQYVREYVAYSDKQNKVADAGSPYTERLNRIVTGVTEVDGIPLNFKVYITKDVNAFACADGSVRVYSGLMDLMNDDEVLGVIGHEVGHVAHKDTKKAFKQALETSALRDVLGSAGGVVGTLSDSQLGALGETLLSKGYSRKQESEADEYGYYFLKAHGRNPLYMATAFQKLNTVSGGKSNMLMQAFSDHPDTNKRIQAIEKLAKKDGYSMSSLTAGTASGSSGASATEAAASTSKTTTKATTNSRSKRPLTKHGGKKK